MLLRPRLSRTLPFALLVITTIGLLAYFPLSKIRAASSRVTILPSAGKPLVNLKSTFSPKLTYAGDGAAVAALQGGTATPTALAAADFNADGAMDVVASYSTKTGGALAIFHGNPDAFAPTDQTLYGKAIVQGKVPPTFLPKASAFALPESAELLATADFNGDGKKDVLVAARGSSNLYLLLGDGTGNLLAPQAVPVPGQVRAFDVTADGHVAVTLDSPSGSQLAILDPSAKSLSSQGLTSQGLVLRATYPLPAQGNSVAWGLLGGGLDVAVGAASNVVMIYGALTSKPQTETVTLPYQVQRLALGNFIWNRDARTEIAVLADDGSIHILQHGTLNTTPLTAAEIPGRRAAIMAQRRLQKGIAPNPTALGPWTEAKQLPYSGPAPSGPVAASAFNSPHVASSSTHDLMVVDGQRGQLHILDTSGKTASPSADVSFSGTPVAALALPNKINSDRDIVVLTSSQATPLLVTSGSSLTLNVNSAGDTDSISACSNSSVTSIPMTLTLREAVCLANNIAMTTTINVPAGTYVLGDSTDAGTGQLLVDTSGSGYSLSIIGEGTAANTIIEQGDGFDRILLGDYYFGGGNPITIENVTLQNGKCTSGNSCDDGGGAVLVGGMPGDDFTVVNVVVYNNQAVEDADQLDWGGGLNNAGSNFTITNCTISNNTSNNQQSGAEANGTGGGVYYTDYPPDVEGTVTITNSSFTNNTSALQGGGLAVMLDTGYPMTVTGSTFTGNAVLTSGRDGGAIAVEQYDETATYVTVSNSRIVGNTEAAGADQPATGISVETETTANLENNWWGCNAGPGGSGCDTVYIETSGGYTPVLTLSIGAGSTSVAPNGSTTLTANLTNTGSCPGYSGCFVPNGTSASFSGGSLGSANPGSTTFSSGVATSTFTAGSGTGSTTASVTVDNQTVDVTINIGTPPAFTSNASTTFTVGTNSSFPVTAVGPPSPTVTQTGGNLPSGVGFSSGTGSGTLSGTPNAGTGGVYSGITFQAANGFTPNATQNFTLTVDQAPSINSSTSASFTFATFGSFTVTTAAGTYPAATFSESGSLPNGVTFSNSGVLSGTPTQAGSFPITITAQNGVSPNASQNFTLNVSQGSTSITVTGVNPSSEPYGQDAAVTITAVLTWTGSGPEPTPGDVSIGGNGPSGYSATICGAPSGDTLTCTATYTPTTADIVGTYTETATFSGDSNYTGSSSSQSNNFSITQASTTTSVMSSQNPSTVGQQVTFTATIDGEYGLVVRRNGAVISGGVSPIKRSTAQRSLPQKGQAHPMDLGGTVTWSSNTGCAASTVSGDPGTAQCITTSLPQGSDTITATYSGDGNHSGSTATLNPNQQVNAAVTPTSISVTSVSPSSEAYGQDAAVTITAVLTWTGSGPEPTPGDVSIGGNGPSGYSATICGAPSGDTLTCTATYTPTTADIVGTYTETATFSGDSNYTGSSSSQSNNFSITQASTTTSVMSSQNPSTVGQQVTFTATIDGEYGLVVRRNGAVISGGVSPIKRSTAQRSLPQKGQAHPMDLGGTVTWSSNTGCAASTVSGDPGTAQCITTSLPQGSDTITATYSGDGNHSGSTATLNPNQQVNAQTPQVTVTPSSINFGTDYLHALKDRNVTVKNTGTSSVTINSVSVTLGSGTNRGDFTALNLCPRTLPAGRSCAINVAFFAGNIGNLSATVYVNDNASGSPQSVGLSATVINPIASFSPAEISYGTVKVGTSVTKNVVLKNVGTTVLTVASIAITGADQGDYSQTNSCPSSLNPGASCPISVTFDPTTTGTRTAGLTVTDNEVGGKQTVPLEGRGSENLE